MKEVDDSKPIEELIVAISLSVHEVKDSRHKILRALFISKVEGVYASVILFIHVEVKLLHKSFICMCRTSDQGSHVLILVLLFDFRVRFIPYVRAGTHFRLGEILIAGGLSFNA